MDPASRHRGHLGHREADRLHASEGSKNFHPLAADQSLRRASGIVASIAQDRPLLGRVVVEW
jgi:hypothetical protein